MPIENIDFFNASALAETLAHAPNGRSVELDLYVHPKSLARFRQECFEKGFVIRKFPPEKRFHLIFERWDSECHVVIDAQIGPFFDRGGITHSSPVDPVLRRIFHIDSLGRERINAFGIAVLYAANCVWLKKQRFGTRHMEKLRSLCLDALNSEETRDADYVGAIRNIAKLDQGSSLAVARSEIARNIGPFFVTRLNHFSQVLPRRTFSFGADSADIIFLGPDGVGKSTLLRAVTEALPLKTASGYLGIGRDGWYLGSAKAMSERSKGRQSHFLFWYLVLPVELLLRRALMLLRGRGRVILIDRVPGVPLLRGGLLRGLYRLILPHPCMVVLLRGDPEQIAVRKPDETTPQRASKELEKWKRVAGGLGDGRILEVDTTMNDPFTCRDMIVEAIRTDPCIAAALYRRPTDRRAS